MKCDLIISFGIFFNAKMDLVFLCWTIITTPNLPDPSVFPTMKSSIPIFLFFFFTYTSEYSLGGVNSFGGDRLSEYSVEAGD
jgi:hypothetical protein